MRYWLILSLSRWIILQFTMGHRKKSFLLATKLNRTKNQTHVYKVCNYNLRSDIRDLVGAVPTEKMLQALQKTYLFTRR